MRRAILVALGTGAVITSAAAIGIGAALSPPNGNFTQAQYEAALRAVEAAQEPVLLGCEAMGGAHREICRTEASATHMVRVAEIESGYRRTEQTARALQRARIDARYQVDRARCQAVSGFKRDKCLVQAHATRGRALLDAAAPYEVRF